MDLMNYLVLKRVRRCLRESHRIAEELSGKAETEQHGKRYCQLSTQCGTVKLDFLLP